MPAAIKSLLSQVFKNIADKGENVRVDSLLNKLKTEGIRDDEIEAAGVRNWLTTEGEDPRNHHGGFETVTNRSGKIAFTPDAIRAMDDVRADRDAVDTGFKTREDTQAQHDLLLKEEHQRDLGMEDGPTGNPDEMRVIEAQEELWRLQAYRQGLPEGDADIRIIDEEIEEAAYNLELEQTAAATNLPEDIARRMAAEQYARINSPLRDIYEGITPEDVDLDTYGIVIFKDPRDVRQPGSKVSYHFGYLDEADYSYHMRYDIELDIVEIPALPPDQYGQNLPTAKKVEALRVFEMQSDLVPVGKQFNFEQWKRQGESQRKKYLSKNSDTKLRNIQDQLEDIEIEIKESAKKEEELYARGEFQARRRLQEQRAELTDSADDLLRLQQSISLPDISETKNMINRALVMGENKGTQEVKFLIDPEEEVWSGRMARTEEVQKHYETVVAGQIRSVAKKIGASVRSDKAGYLIVGLPAAGFTLPLYAEENKEASYLATADLRGEDTEEAKAYLDHKEKHSFVFPFPDKEEETPPEPTTNFNTGGKVLGSLHRNCG